MSREGTRQEILKAAIEVFARKGFRGTTTRDLAAQADVSEALIFRHFNTKQELYRAILEEKAHQSRQAQCAELHEMAAETREDSAFLEAVGQKFLERHAEDSTFMRLLLFSALEGHELSEMFLQSFEGRDPLASYLERRMEEGAFRRMDPHLAARAFLGMFVFFVQMQEIFGQKRVRNFEREETVRTFVSIFLSGMRTP